MKILFTNKVSPRYHGGSDVRIKEIGIRLAKQGHTIYALSAKTKIYDKKYEELSGIKIYCIKVLPNFILKQKWCPIYLPLSLFYLFSPIIISRFLKKHSIDAIRDSMSPFPAMSLLALRKQKVPTIVVLHELFDTFKKWRELYGFIYGLPGYIFEKLLLNGNLKYDYIITDGNWLAEKIKKQSPKIKGRVLYLPNGVDTQQFKPGIYTKNAEIKMLNIARFVKHKAHKYIVEAMKKIVKTQKNISIDIIGDGPLKNKIAGKIKEYKLENYINFIDPVEHSAMPGLYQQYDIFILPSLWEGLPLTLLEAMASGIPILTSGIPATQGVVNDSSAVICRPADVNDLKEKIIKISSDYQLRQRIRDMALAESKKFDWDIIAQKELDLLKK